ncbi:aminopeptidase [Candidatus Woesearchaeota archaeon]|nr:aminopeptidase [Candidatus Woesearchaeota archaeon]MBL7051226.1 aminopeptidase [Candidatus Woesearchaeota archaeon]
MGELKQATITILNTCIQAKEGESVLIITDKNKKEIANSLVNASKELSLKPTLIEIPELKINGQEPPESTAQTMKEFDICILVTSKSLTHTKARRSACEAGARIATMPNATVEMIKRTIPINYQELQERNTKLVKLLEKTEIVRVTTQKGTDITMNIKGRDIHGINDGLYTQKGQYGNLPCGEVCLAPIEGTTNGKFIVDASMGTGKLPSPLTIEVKNGFATSITGEHAQKIKDMFKDLPKEAYNIAELGIGTNPNAKITGNVLEDEKVLGTAHIALGNNKSFGGDVDVPIHIDGIFRAPTIYLDSKMIIEQGKFLI